MAHGKRKRRNLEFVHSRDATPCDTEDDTVCKTSLTGDSKCHGAGMEESPEKSKLPAPVGKDLHPGSDKPWPRGPGRGWGYGFRACRLGCKTIPNSVGLKGESLFGRRAVFGRGVGRTRYR